jgi:hypothetical protein
VGRGGNRPFFSTDYLIPEYFLYDKSNGDILFLFRRHSIKVLFLLKFFTKDTEISKKEQFDFNHIQHVLKIEFYDDFEHKEIKNQNIVPTVFRDIRNFVIISITSRFCFLLTCIFFMLRISIKLILRK